MSCTGGCQSQNNFHQRSQSFFSLPCFVAIPYSLDLARVVGVSIVAICFACATAPGGCHDLQCCSPPLSFSSSLMCLSSSSRCCLWMPSFSLSFFKLRTPSASGTIYRRLQCYLSLSFSRMNLFS